MAEEEESGEEQDQEGDLTPPGRAAEKPQESKKTLIIVAAVVGFLIIVIIAVLIIVLMSDSEQGGIRGTAEESEFVDLYNKRMQSSLDPIDEPVYSEPFSYSVNMKNGLNYIHLTFIAVFKDPLAKTHLESRTPLIDDIMISLLREKYPRDIKTRIGLEMLKQEIFIEVNKLFPQEYIDQSLTKDRMPVKDILFNEFYIQ
jgi:flagellar basal body-associated protein FliL